MKQPNNRAARKLSSKVPISRLRLQKMMPLVTSSRSKSARRAARFFIGATSIRACDTFLFVEEGVLPQCAWALAGIVPTGVISGGMVAEKNNVWRVKGRSFTMRSISDKSHIQHGRLRQSPELQHHADHLAALNMVEQAAGRGNQNIGTSFNGALLIAE